MRKEFEKIFADEEFVKELMLKETREEAKKAIEEKGVSVTDDDMEEIYKFYSAIYEECKNMSKADLEKIAGGCGLHEAWQKVVNFGSNVRNKFRPGSGGDSEQCPATGFGQPANGVNAPASASGGGLGAVALAFGPAILGGAAQVGASAMNAWGAKEAAKSNAAAAASAAQISRDNLEREKNKADAIVKGIAIVSAAGLIYTFRDDIRSWLKK